MRMFNTIEVEMIESGILIITLNRPEKLNALNKETIEELLTVMEEIEKGFPEKYKAVILRGSGRGFCSGGDLEEFEELLEKDKNEIEKYIALFHWFAHKLYELPLPTIACIHGPTAGGGASLSLLCDIRIAAEDTKMQFLFSKIGLISDIGTHYTLPEIVGISKAMELMYLGRPILADEALKIGLVNHVLPKNDIDQFAVEMAKQIVKNSSAVHSITKSLARNKSDKTLSDILSKEIIYQTNRFKSPEMMEAVQKFLQ